MKKTFKFLLVVFLVVLLTGCTTSLTKTVKKNGHNQKTIIKYDEGKNATGQSLTKHIICKPTDKNLVKIYKKNGVNTDKLVSCSSFKPTITKTEGIWDNIFIKPLAWLILKL